MAEKNCYFLDTSTQIARHWEGEQKIRKVQSDLEGWKLQSSVYVEREYRCRILNSLIKIHVLVKKSDSLEEAEGRLDNIAGVERLIYVIAKRLFRKYQSVKPFLTCLKRWIEEDWENYFYDRLGRELVDMTKCTRGVDAPGYVRGLYKPISTKCLGGCEIADFWNAKAEDLKKLAAMKANDAKGSMAEVRNQAAGVLQGNTAEGEACRTLGDAVISIEARDGCQGSIIHTMDADFESLSPVLETSVRRLRL
jgi:hypothetical protein